MFFLFLVSSFFLRGFFGFGFVDSFGQSIDFGFQLVDFSGQFSNFGGQGVSGDLVFVNPVFVVSSFDFSGFSDFTDQVVTQSNNSVDGGLVGLDGGIGGDGGQDVEDSVPRFSFELRFSVFGQVGRNLSESGGGFFSSLQERGFHGVNDDLFGFFDNGQGFVMLSLFFSPFLVFQGFVGV